MPAVAWTDYDVCTRALVYLVRKVVAAILVAYGAMIVVYGLAESPEAVALGLLMAAAGWVAFSSRPPEPLDVGEALAELASEAPPRLPEEGGREVTATVKLRSSGLRDRDVSRLADLIAGRHGVAMEAFRPRLSSVYLVRVRGREARVRGALRDLARFCRATGRCRVDLESLEPPRAAAPSRAS